MNGSKIAKTLVKLLAVGVALVLPVPTIAAEKSETTDMELIEFLGSFEAEGNQGNEILTVIDTALLPELPEEPPYDESK